VLNPTEKRMRPRNQTVIVWEQQYEQIFSQPDNSPIEATRGDWITKHPSGWMEKLTRRELDDRYEEITTAKAPAL